MRRKLVGLDMLGDLEKRSLTHSGRELSEAAGILGRVIGTPELQFKFFDEGTVVYRVPGGNYIHASYKIDEGAVTFDGISEYVIDKDSIKAKLREHAANIVDAVIDGDRSKADYAFHEYVSLALSTREQKKKIEESSCGLSHKQGPKNFKFPTDGGKKVKASSKKVTEWAKIASNVMGYVGFMESGDILAQAKIKKAPSGDVVGVRIPDRDARNEGKILHMTYKTLMSTDLKWLRESANTLVNDQDFVKTVCELKRMAKLGMNKELEESFGKAAVAFPPTLLLTQSELANVVREALDQNSDGNFDDADCDFIAEGVLREAHKGFIDRVQTVAKLAGVPHEEEITYGHFQKIAEGFYPRLDEQSANEHKMFEDLYEAITEVRHAATSCENEDVRAESAEVLSGLYDIVAGVKPPTLEAAHKAAAWLGIVAESSNFIRGQHDWQVDTSVWPHVTQVGEHPSLSSLPKISGDPGMTNDLWQDYPGGAALGDNGEYPTAKSARDLGRKGFGNVGSTDWSNPYMPKAPDIYTMGTAKGVDKGTDDALGQNDGGEAWPNIKHDHLPNSSYPKMNAGNLVDTRPGK